MSQPFEPLPPHNAEAEAAVLGSLLMDSSAIELVVPILAPRDFYRPANRDVFAAMVALFEQRIPTDYVAVCAEMERRDTFAPAGGDQYVASLLTAVPTSIHVEHYAAIVQRCAYQRGLIQRAGRIAAIGYEGLDSIQEMQTAAEGELFELADQRPAVGLQPLAQIIADTHMTIGDPSADGLEAPANRFGYPTGFLDLDARLGSLRRGELILVAARPSVGKTALALNIAKHVACDLNGGVALFSIEMGAVAIADRFMSAESRITSTRIREIRETRRCSPIEGQWLIDAYRAFEHAPIWVDETAGLPLLEARAKARRQHHEHPLAVVMVDYLQLMRHAPAPNRVQEISEIGRGLKALAKELNVAVLAVSQLNRAVEGRVGHEPQMSDLRDSGTLEQDADVILMLWRAEDEDMEGVIHVKIEKHRNGPTGKVSLGWQDQTTRFVNLERSRV